jgi:DNA-binding transcriptional LysR family regulator
VVFGGRGSIGTGQHRLRPDRLEQPPEERGALVAHLHADVVDGRALAFQAAAGLLDSQVRFIAAAAPDHPLHRLGRVLTLDDLREHRHLFVRDTATRREAQTGRELTEARWTFSNKAKSIRAACMGLGFAWYAEDQIRQELDAGELKPLPLEQGAERWTTLYLASAGPGTRRLAAILNAAVSSACADANRPG